MVKPMGWALLGVLLFSGSAIADDIAKGQEIARSCIMCHGVNGESRIEAYPSLRGMNEQVFIDAMFAYKAGEKEGNLAGLMRSQVMHLSDEDINNLAAYYASLK